MRKILLIFIFSAIFSACQLIPQPPQPIPGPSEEPANPTNLDLNAVTSPTPEHLQDDTAANPTTLTKEKTN